MFLLNMFGRSNPPPQQRCDKIQFKINLEDNIPQFYEYPEESVIMEQQELTPSHPSYYAIFPKDEEPFTEYVVSENDTIFGIAIKLEISVQTIKDLNNISSYIYPGMKLKLPLTIDLQKLHSLEDKEQNQKMPISKLLHANTISEGILEEERLSSLLGSNNKYHVEYYAGLSGYIEGFITINYNYIIFNPSLDSKNNLKKFAVERLLKFNMIVENVDIQDIIEMELPEMPNEEDMSVENPYPKIIYVIQFMLFKVGNTKLEHKYKDKFKEFRKSNKPIASMSFAVKNVDIPSSTQHNLSEKNIQRKFTTTQQTQFQEKLNKSQKNISQTSISSEHSTNSPFKQFSEQKNERLSDTKKVVEQIVTKVKLILSKISQKSQKQIKLELPEQQSNENKLRLTNIPFFDIIHDNITRTRKNSEVQIQQELNKIIRPDASLGVLSESSDIVTSQQFANLIIKFPIMYKLCNWQKVYASTRDGSSFNTFLNKSKNVSPAIIFIKEYKGYKIGAFLIDSIETGKTGRGEMFIFTFKDNPVPEVYNWSGKNQTFVYTERQTGIGIGMGFKYGIYIKNTLDKGSSAPTNTFGNENILSKKQDFYIEEIEIWGIDNEY